MRTMILIEIDDKDNMPEKYVVTYVMIIINHAMHDITTSSIGIPYKNIRQI